MNYYQHTAEEQANYKIRRNKDCKDEKIVGDWLDKYFYPTWTSSTERCYSLYEQVSGLDITVTGNTNVVYTIDEKAATQWAGRNLQTFAHEISSVNVSGYEYDGWLVDFNSMSEYLVEVWIDEINSADGKIYDYTNITEGTVVLIKKSDLWGYLKKKGVNSKELKEVGEYLRNNGLYSAQYKGYKVTCQQKYQEHAANILIPRDTLINTISTYAVRIRNNRIETLRKKV